MADSFKTYIASHLTKIFFNHYDINWLVQPKLKTTTYCHATIKFQGSNLWNNLRDDFLKKINDSLTYFKCEIQKWSVGIVYSAFWYPCKVIVYIVLFVHFSSSYW